MTTVIKSGWLTKEGGRYKNWKKRWCTIENGLFVYYKKENRKEKCGEVNLRVVSNVQNVDYRGKKNCFEVVTPERVYHMCTDTVAEKDAWVEALSKLKEDLKPSKNKSTVSISTPAGPSSGGKITGESNGVKKATAEDFDLLKVIGRGSFGKVLMVRKKDNGKVYAMKVLHKQTIIERNEVLHTKAEKSILMKLEHPFLVKLHYSFQDVENLYFIMDFVNGGELFYHLQKDKIFSEDRARFYAAQIASGLEYLHSAGVIYRDLKPENLLLNRDGHIIMTDFGLSKEGVFDKDRTATFCGTPEYLAPEVLEGKGYNKAVDWWSFGTLIYEMLNGLPPFYNEDVQVMYTKILTAELKIPSRLSPEAKNLLERLLDRNPDTRLQNPEEIKRHPYFAGIDWDLLLKKQLKPPFIPDVKNEFDVNNIDISFTSEHPTVENDESVPGPPDPSQAKTFEGFTYVSKH